MQTSPHFSSDMNFRSLLIQKGYDIHAVDTELLNFSTRDASFFSNLWLAKPSPLASQFRHGPRLNWCDQPLVGREPYGTGRCDIVGVVDEQSIHFNTILMFHLFCGDDLPKCHFIHKDGCSAVWMIRDHFSHFWSCATHGNEPIAPTNCYQQRILQALKTARASLRECGPKDA